MPDETVSLQSENQGEFGRSFVVVLCAHVVLIAAAWVGGRALLKRAAPEPVTWLDGGGELASASPLGATESGAAAPTPLIPEPAPQVLPPLPPEPVTPSKDTSEIPMVVKAKETPIPTPTPKPRQKIATPTPRTNSPTATPKPNPASRITPTPTKKATPEKPVAKLATPKSPRPVVVEKKKTDFPAKPFGAEPGEANPQPGSGDAPSPGTKGGPGAPGGTDAVTLTYFKKVEAHFRREWKKPLTVVRSGRVMEAFVRLRAAADGTVESLTLVKRTGNPEVDQSIEQALRRVKKVEPPPTELLKNGVLDELVEFVLEL